MKNDQYILKKDHVTGLLRRLMKDYRLVAPVRNPHGDTLFAEIDALDTANLDLDNQTQASLKPFFLPQQEVLFAYDRPDRASYRFTNPATATPTVFFGVRSCDLSAVLYMDVIFSRRGRDPYYFQKRREAVLITLACNEPSPNCFCNANKTGPYLEYGFDLQLTDLGDRYYVEIGRARGAGIVDRLKPFFAPAEDQDSKAQYQAFLEARGRFKQQIHVDQAVKRLLKSPVPEDIWTELSRRCQDCGGCAYICPTCTCFMIADRELSPTTGERLRSWDACTFGGFTRMAGGHNPVKPGHAVRQRFLHKMLYDVREHGRPSCVGCGRCVGICFGGVDIVRFINMVCD